MHYRSHIDADLRIYVCLSEICGAGLEPFPSRTQWDEHMISHHSYRPDAVSNESNPALPMGQDNDWTREIHRGLWYCDLGHESRVPFSNLIKYRTHLENDHQLEQRKVDICQRRNRERGIRPPLFCPLCEREPSPPNGSKITSRSDLLMHIEGHLRSLAMLSLPEPTQGYGDPQHMDVYSIEMMSNHEDVARERSVGDELEVLVHGDQEPPRDIAIDSQSVPSPSKGTMEVLRVLLEAKMSRYTREDDEVLSDLHTKPADVRQCPLCLEHHPRKSFTRSVQAHYMRWVCQLCDQSFSRADRAKEHHRVRHGCDLPQCHLVNEARVLDPAWVGPILRRSTLASTEWVPNLSKPGNHLNTALMLSDDQQFRYIVALCEKSRTALAALRVLLNEPNYKPAWHETLATFNSLHGDDPLAGLSNEAARRCEGGLRAATSHELIKRVMQTIRWAAQSGSDEESGAKTSDSQEVMQQLERVLSPHLLGFTDQDRDLSFLVGSTPDRLGSYAGATVRTGGELGAAHDTHAVGVLDNSREPLFGHDPDPSMDQNYVLANIGSNPVIADQAAEASAREPEWAVYEDMD